MLYDMAQGSLDSDRLSSAGLSTHSSVGTVGTLGGGGSVVGVRDSGHKQDDEDEYSLGPLPPLWEKAYTPTGEVYFIDHNTGTSHWLDPRLARVRKRSLAECAEHELPYGWERVRDDRYGAYYVDHINRRTQYENPVLQARRLRAEKLAAESGTVASVSGTGAADAASIRTNSTGVAAPRDPDQLRGERFTVTLTKSSQGLGFTLVGGAGCGSQNGDAELETEEQQEGFLQIRSIVPHSPAWLDGALVAGDVLVSVCGRRVLGATHAAVAALFQSIPPGTQVTLELCRGYPLAYDTEDPHTRVLTTVAVEAAPTPDDGSAMQHLTDALRTRFNLESPTKRSDVSLGDTELEVSQVGSGGARRLLGRSFDMDGARCSSADLLSASSGSGGAGGTELTLRLRRGAAGFGFTIADSVHGQKVKKVLDRGRCAGLREGDLLLEIGDTDVRHMPHQHVVQVLKECPAMQETTLRVWRRPSANTRTPRSRSATRVDTNSSGLSGQQLSRSKTPTAEQCAALGGRTGSGLASPVLTNRGTNGMSSPRLTGRGSNGLSSPVLSSRVNSGMGSPARSRDGQQQRSKTPLVDTRLHGTGDGDEGGNDTVDSGDSAGRRRRSSTPGGRGESGLSPYWRHNASVAESSDNGGFPDEGTMSPPSTAAVGGARHAPAPSPSCFACHTGTDSPPQPNLGGSTVGVGAMQQMSSAAYPQVEAGGVVDPEADVLVRLARGAAGFGFRIVGGTEDGSRVAVGHVVPGGPAEGLLRPGDLLTSVDSLPLLGASHAQAVAAVCRAAANGHVTLGVRHNRADIQHVGMAQNHMNVISPHQQLLSVPGDLGLGGMTYGVDGSPGYTVTPQRQPHQFNILHPAPIYQHHHDSRYMHPVYDPTSYGAYHATGAAPYDVVVTRGEGEGFGFVVISSTNKATSTIGQLIPGSPAARSNQLRVGDTILAINRTPVRRLPHPEVVALIKQSGRSVTLTVAPPDYPVD